MISYFNVQNYRSIANATLDLRYAEGKAPNSFQTMERMPFIVGKQGGVRVVPCLGLYGSNANGKTNLLRALETLHRLVVDPFVDVRNHYDGNRLITSYDTTVFALGVCDDKTEYEYLVEYSDQRMVRERLCTAGKTVYEITPEGNNFDSIANDEAFTVGVIEDLFKGECFDVNGVWRRPFLNSIGNRRARMNMELSWVFNIISMGFFMLGDQPTVGEFPIAIERLCDVLGCDQTTALDEVMDIVRKMDMDIQGVKIEEKDVAESKPFGGLDIIRRDTSTNETKRVFIRSSHVNDQGVDVWFDFIAQESSGTVRIATIVAYMLAALHDGRLVVVDELDRSLHPLLVRALVGLFTKRFRNQDGAQLVFSTHCTDLLDDEIFRLSEVGIVLKNKNRGTFVKRLCDFRKAGEDVRNVTNFRKAYLDGFYAGVPYPAV